MVDKNDLTVKDNLDIDVNVRNHYENFEKKGFYI